MPAWLCKDLSRLSWSHFLQNFPTGSASSSCISTSNRNSFTVRSERRTFDLKFSFLLIIQFSDSTILSQVSYIEVSATPRANADIHQPDLTLTFALDCKPHSRCLMKRL